MGYTLYQCFHTIGFKGGLITSPSDVTLKPLGASKTLVQVHPLDVAIEESVGIMGSDVSIAPNP
eukprot:10614989-Ditylum_brightwellii.AAC.1